MIYVVLSSANRDERFFPHPEMLDPLRDSNRHMAFGYGIHFCIGAPLARLEVRVALETLHQRFPHLRLVPNQIITYTPGLLMRGIEHVLISTQIPKV